MLSALEALLEDVEDVDPASAGSKEDK